MKRIIINTDGGSRNNPGKAAAGFVVFDEAGKVLDRGGKFLGISTNNEAEYEAIKLSLWKAGEMENPKSLEIEIKSDSRLIVEQLNGNFKVKNLRMRTYVEDIKELESKFGHVSYTLIPREENTLADSIVNNIQDNHS